MRFSINDLEFKMPAASVAMALALFFCTSASYAGLLASGTNAAQTGTGVQKFLERKTEAFKGIMNDFMDGKDSSALHKANEALSGAPGELIMDTSFALSAVDNIARRASNASRRLKNLAGTMRHGLDSTVADVRALAVSKVKGGDGWSESASLRLHEPIRKLKTAFVRKSPSARTAGHSGKAGEARSQGIYRSSGKPKEWKDYEKYRNAAVENWERNATARQKGLQKTMGVGPEVKGFHEYLQEQKSGGAYSDALANMSGSGGYASVLEGLDDKERKQIEERRQAEEERVRQEEERLRFEEEQRELARIEGEQERERQRQYEREEREREEEQRRMDRLEQEQQHAIRQQAWQNITDTLTNFTQQMQGQYSGGTHTKTQTCAFSYDPSYHCGSPSRTR